LSAAPPAGSSQPSTRYMPRNVSLMSNERSSKPSSLSRSKPSQSPSDSCLACQVAELFDREALGEIDPVVFVYQRSLLADLLAEVADDRGGLITDRAGPQRVRDSGQIAQLLADAQAIGRRSLGHLALHRNPGARRLAGEKVVTTPGGRCDYATELRLETIHAGGKLRGIDERIVLSLNSSDRRAQILHGKNCIKRKFACQEPT